MYFIVEIPFMTLGSFVFPGQNNLFPLSPLLNLSLKAVIGERTSRLHRAQYSSATAEAATLSKATAPDVPVVCVLSVIDPDQT